MIANESFFDTLNVDVFEMNFQMNSNSSSPVSSIFQINAYDSNNNNIELDLSQNGTSTTTNYIQMNFQLKKNYSSLFKTSLNPKLKIQYFPVCVYLDPATNKWS